MLVPLEGSLFIALLFWILSFISPTTGAKYLLDVPFFCVDEDILAIFSSRLTCLSSPHPLSTTNFKGFEASELFRIHELIAYDWMVLTKDNPYRKSCSDPNVLLEYIPFMPLHTVAARSGKALEIGGPRNQSFACSYASLIADIERYVTQKKPSHRKLFSVAGTFNLRTEMGIRGMESDVRRGSQYDRVTSFVTSIFLGHYERFPQCPDLLRKHWPGVLEMPYVPPSFLASVGAADRDVSAAATAAARGISPRNIPFLFVGRLWMFGPERVCSVRNTIAALAVGSLKASVVVVNTTSSSSQLSPTIINLYSRAVFCLVAKGDSYSTSALFAALDAGCVPVLLSDWFVPAFNWAVPWHAIALRIKEQDFLASPEAALQRLKDIPAAQVEEMRQQASIWRRWLSYTKVASATLNEMRELIGHYVLPSPPVGTVVPALELFLYELLYHPGGKTTPSALTAKGSSADPKATGLSCETPFHCPLPAFLLQPLQISGLIDKRSFLCRNVHRFIGQYKMVFNQKCVRILWPLKPGVFRAPDEQRLTLGEKAFVQQFHQRGFADDLYPLNSSQLAAQRNSLGVVQLSQVDSLR